MLPSAPWWAGPRHVVAIAAIVSAGQLLGSCWAPANQRAPLSPSHLPPAGQTHHCLCRDCLQTRHALCPRRRNTLPLKHAARRPLDIRHPTCARHAACVRQPLDCLCRESLRTPRHMTGPLSPSQPLPSTCAPASIPTHTHTNHTQIIHSIASVITPSISNNTQPDCRHAALIAQSPPHPQPLFAHHLPHCRPTVNPTKLILHRLLHPLLSCQQFGSRILVATPASCWERSLYRRHEQSYSESRSIAPSLSMPSLCSLPTLWPWFTLALPKPPLH
jgi:hypothetical protein